MAIRYKLYQDNRSNSQFPGKWYARATHDYIVDLDGLAEHMSNHNYGYTKGQIKGLLTDMVGCIKELVADSKKVKLDGLAIFYASIKSSPADSPETFMPSKNIVAKRLGCMPTGEMGTALLTRTWKVSELADYTRPTSETSTGEEEGQ